MSAGPALAATRSGITARPPRATVADESGDPRTPLPVPSVVVYRVETDGHRQTGVLVEVAVDDYRRGRIRRHEATRPDQEREVARSTATSGTERAPVTLAHAHRPELDAVVRETAEGAPDVRLHRDGLTHIVWTRQDPRALRTVLDELTGLDALYLADGHHRMAAAARRSGTGRSAFTLAALFPQEQMRVLGYHRCLPRPTTSTSDLLGALAQHPATARVERCTEPQAPETLLPEPGVVVMVLDGCWYRIHLRSLHEPADVRASLDVVQLDEGLLPRIAQGPATAVSGGSDPVEVARRCDREGSVGFLLHPPTVAQVVAVADTGQVLPAKSTWFDPKTSSGLFLRALS